MLKNGDKIYIQRPGFRHYGIYLGFDWRYGHCVAHNDKSLGVEIVTWADFANGEDVLIAQSAPGNPAAQNAIVKRALSLVGKEYNLALYNCEHFANYAQTGVPYSNQVIGACALGLLLLLLVR